MNLNNISQIRYGGKDIVLGKLNGDILYRKETEEPIDNPYYVEYTIVPANNTDVVSALCKGTSANYYRKYLPSIWGSSAPSDQSCHNIIITLNSGDTTTDIDNTLAKDVAKIRAYYDKDIEQLCFAGFNSNNPNYIKTLISINKDKLTTFANLFLNCTKFIGYRDGTLDLDISGVSSTSRMFYNCESLESVNFLTGLERNNITDMSYMFYGCKNLFINYLRNMDVSNVTDMSHMFDGCKKLQPLESLTDLSSWDTSRVTNMDYMFFDCSVGFKGMENWNVSSLERAESMFNQMKVGNASINWSAPNLYNVDHMFNDCNTNGLTITIRDAEQLGTIDYFCSGSNVQNVEFNNCSNIQYARYAFSDCSMLSQVYSDNPLHLYNSEYMFANCTNLYSYPTFSYLENCDHMFYGSSISEFDMSDITIGSSANFTSMFENCYNLYSFYNNNYDYQSYSLNASYMFKECNNIQYVYFENESISVNECTEMFYNCYNISEIKLNSFDTSSCYSYDNMFYSVYGSIYVGSYWTLAEYETGYDGSFIW